jgi:hypothetical protein
MADLSARGHPGQCSFMPSSGLFTSELRQAIEESAMIVQ